MNFFKTTNVKDKTKKILM